jgi:pyridoxine 5-phosphate synthase
MLSLHVNVDHVATVRQARMESFPDPVAWALAAERAGADGITCHLRKDRRHIQDDDVVRLRAEIKTILNLETSLDPEMLACALESGADAFCIVPENRAEVTTEGGLNVRAESSRLNEIIAALSAAGGAVSLFVDPELEQLDASKAAGASFVELHTGCYANARGKQRALEGARLEKAARHAHAIGLRVNAGHGLDYDNLEPVLALPHLEELNIGFAIVARAITSGVENAVATMKTLVTSVSR